MKLELPDRRTLAVLAALLGYASAPMAEEPWRFRLSPYIWFAGLEGDIASIPGLPAAPVDISASDALDDTDASFMFVLDAKKGRHGIFTDFLYSDLRSDEEIIPPPIDLTLRSTTKTTLLTLAYEYEVYNQDQVVVDLLAGARYWDIDSELFVKSGPAILAGLKRSHRESWTDPLIGARGRMPLGASRFYVMGSAGLGGFGVASDHLYEFSANIGYQWTKALGTGVGYRKFDVDYDHKDYLYDVKQQGWQVGLTWAF